LACLLIAGAAHVLGGQTAAADADESIVSLPPLMVEEKGIALRWRYLELPGLELLSVCDDATAEKLVRRQLRLEELLRVLLPNTMRVQLAVPEAYILFNEETGRARSREVIAEMVQRHGATVAPNGMVILPPVRGRGLMGRGEQRIRFLPNMRLADSDAVRVFAIVRDHADGPMDYTFAIDRIAFLLRRRTPALPDWFVEGMLTLYRQTRFGADEIEFQPLTWISGEETAALARDPHSPRTLLPMEDLFGTRRPPATGNPSEMDRVWRAQSALFVRWALGDPTGVRRTALWRWIEGHDAAPAGEAAFRTCFGIGYSDARDRLSDYLPVAVGQRTTLPAPKPGPRPRIRFRDATDLEIARIRGDWERLQIPYVRQRYPSLVGNYIEQARRTLARVHTRGERDPRLLAVLGLTECDAGNPAGAREYLEAAVHGQVVRPRAYLELASLRFQELQGEEKLRRLNPAEVRSVLTPLLSARLQEPPLPEVYGLIADVWLQSAHPPLPSDLAVLAEGVRHFPGEAALVVRAIHLHEIHGSYSTAAELTASGLRHARDPKVRERLERVRAELTALKP
jgi:hypothetical protein